MFDRFTDRAKRVMNLACDQARRLNHEYIGTEHILLGIVEEGSGIAANALKNLDIDLKRIREEVEKVAKIGPSMVTIVQLPFTPGSKKVLELALEESSNLGHTYIGTEHLLLGLIREHDGRAAKVLQGFGLKLDTVREEILNFLGAAPPVSEDEDQSAETLCSPGIIGEVVEVEVDSSERHPGAILAGTVTGYAKCGEIVYLQVTFPLFVQEFLQAPVMGWALAVRPGEDTCTLRGIPRENVVGFDGPTFNARIRRIGE